MQSLILNSRLSCTRPGFDQGLMILFTNTAEDSELRIGAYLALMSCPSQETVNQVKMVLTDEPVNQVGSFVWTHLTNLQETQSISPNKRALKRLVGTEFLKNKWNTDVRKFSRFFETSHYNKVIVFLPIISCSYLLYNFHASKTWILLSYRISTWDLPLMETSSFLKTAMFHDLQW